MTETKLRRREARRNQGHRYRSVVGARGTGSTLVAWLAANYPHSDPATWTERILEGEVRVGGGPATPGTIVRQGMEVVWDRPPWVEEAVPLHFDVVYQDAWLLAVNKPAGLPTLAAGGFLEHTLQHQVGERIPGAHALHRLGRGTSGLVLFGRSGGARAALSQALRERRIERGYVALASGHPPWQRATLQTPIGPMPHPILGTLHAAKPDGKPARTEVEVLRSERGDSWVRAHLVTGRPHQIRIHLAAAGHPLVGDPLFLAGGLPRPDALPGDAGYLLHAETLAFVHPKTGAEMRLQAPPPWEGWGGS